MSVFVTAAVALWSQEPDTTNTSNKDAIFQRPFVLQGEKGTLTAAVGGYLEANTNYFSTDGVSEGFSMEMRRFNIFLYSTIAERIRFLSELEFEHGTEEIKLETALIDFEIHPSLIFRGGIILPPLGYFNQNHDSPKWEFIDRPLVSTSIIPSTYSDVGFGIHGSFPVGSWLLTYETYVINGLQDPIASNESNRTFIPAGKTEEIFGEDNNGSPAWTMRAGLKYRRLGEVGLSLYTGAYNTYRLDGLDIDQKRNLTIAAIDLNFEIGKVTFRGEAAFASIGRPLDSETQFGSEQWGLHSDIIWPFWQGDLWGWKDISFNGAFRFEYVDFNLDSFPQTGGSIGDHIVAAVPGVSLRFSPSTLLRFNYRYHWETDFLQNPAVRTAGFQFGFASYF